MIDLSFVGISVEEFKEAWGRYGKAINNFNSGIERIGKMRKYETSEEFEGVDAPKFEIGDRVCLRFNRTDQLLIVLCSGVTNVVTFGGTVIRSQSSSFQVGNIVSFFNKSSFDNYYGKTSLISKRS